MIIKRELGEKGQIVIPKDIRKFLGLEKGEEIIFEVKGQDVLLKKNEDSKKLLHEFFTLARPEKKHKNITIQDIKKILDEQYELS